MTDGFYHEPVMPAEVEEYLVSRPEGLYVDCTLGGGGHTARLLERHCGLRVVALDLDEAAMDEAVRRLAGFGGRITLFRENFRNLASLVREKGLPLFDGVLADLGVSSRQLDDRSRGFSFRSDTLDMRMDTRSGRRALDLVNELDAASLADIIYRYGEERLSRPISRRIVEERKKGAIETGEALAAVVEKVKRRHGRTHPATNVFQALRIAVNEEMRNLEELLESLPAVLAPGGRAVIISYHSLEDRLVKHSFRSGGAEGVYRVLTKKVVCPSPGEISGNPRSRSAKLRAVERI